jgi:hypothetical protein
LLKPKRRPATLLKCLIVNFTLWNTSDQFNVSLWL